MIFKGKNLCDFCFEPIKPGEKCPNCGLTHETYNLPVGLLTPGTNIMGMYIVGKVLGRGGFGATYLAYSSKHEGVVALKEYLPVNITYRGKGEEAVSIVSEDKRELFDKGAKRFYREAQTIYGFGSNKNIVSVYQFFYANNTAYFAMEYLDGNDLKKYIEKKGGRLGGDEATKIAAEVCEALKFVHSSDMLHRDLTPDNIFICSNGDVKLIDFGSARQIMSEENRSYSVLVKQGFAPPEQYMTNGKQGPWTDIYSLGATMYYALTGKIPPDAASLYESGISFESFGNISNKLKLIISNCMRYHITDRYQNVDELLSALKSGAKPNPPPSGDSEKPEDISSGGGSNVEPRKNWFEKIMSNLPNDRVTRGILVAIALLLACMVIVGIISLINNNTSNNFSTNTSTTSSSNFEFDNGLNEVREILDELEPANTHKIDDNVIADIISSNCNYTEFGINVINRTTGYTYGYNENYSYPASAMSQVVILDTLSQIVKTQGIDIDEYTMRFEYIMNGKEAPGSEYQSGQYLPIREYVEDVAVYGDNNKSNLLIDYIAYISESYSGFDVINSMLTANGYANTRVNRKTYTNSAYIDETVEPNKTTARDIAGIFNNLIFNSGYGDEAYMKNIFRSVSNDGKAIGLKKVVEGNYNVYNANAINSQSTNNVAVIEDGNTQIIVSILAYTQEGKTNSEGGNFRDNVIGKIVNYIISTQFE